jgi:hypothetical protein
LPPTNGRIALGDEWLDLLTAPAPAVDSQDRLWEASTIERIFESAGLGDITYSNNKSTVTEDWFSGELSPDGGKTRLLEESSLASS